MEKFEMSDRIDHHRRRFITIAALTIAAARLDSARSANAQPSNIKLPAIRPGTNTSFASLKQIDADVLNVGYAEAGPAAILLHGWPYDIHSCVDVAPLLASAGYRVIVSYLRGYGTTRFLSSGTFRNGQQSVVAIDAIALMDALKIERATRERGDGPAAWEAAAKAARRDGALKSRYEVTSQWGGSFK